MDSTDPDRRTVLKSLAAATIASSYISGITTARGAGRSDVSSQNVEMDTLKYNFDYDIDRFNGDNVSNSGSVHYEQKKYAADSSYFTWQSGTWVNAADDSRESNSFSGNVWAPGSKHSKVVVGKDSTETDLYFGQSYAYTDDQDEEFPEAAWTDYAFDVAWSYMRNVSPIFLPPRPPSVGQNSNETSIDSGPDGATIEFYDPEPTTSETPYGATHSADWRWDASGALNPGWNFTEAKRKVDVGEYIWETNTGWTFGQEQNHQLTFGTGFCIYTEDKTVCETDGCVRDPCPSPGDDDIATELQECCQLETVADPIPVTDEHLKAAAADARKQSATDRVPRSRFEEQAVLGVDTASKMERSLRKLVAYRSATAHARGADVRAERAQARVTPSNATDQATRTIAATERVHDRLKYTGSTLDEAVAMAGQIEKRLASAQRWAESAAKSFSVDSLSSGQRTQYAEAGMEFAQGNLSDAEYYKDAAANRSGIDQSNELSSLYDSLAESITSNLEDSPSPADDHVEYAVLNVRSYLDRAESRRDTFLAAAVLDLFHASAYRTASDNLSRTDFDAIDEMALQVEQELVSDHFNRVATDFDGQVQRFLLQLASLEYNTGVESFGTFKAMDDPVEARRAYRHFVTAEAIVEVASSLYDSFELR